MRIAIIGNGSREHALTWKLSQSSGYTLFNFGPTTNPGIAQLATCGLGKTDDIPAVVEWAKNNTIDVAWIGPEAPLAAGIVDALEGTGISCIGPTQALARLESSKSFTRDLLNEYDIKASPVYRIFTSLHEIEDFMKSLDGNIVVKPDGLTGGKGVRVMGDHFHSIPEALQYCQDLFTAGDERVVIEEKLIGQEFSLMSFTDGKHLVHLPIVQDHKRVFVNDEGANTGGMGSYSMPDHALPFISAQDVIQAQSINEEVLHALTLACAEEYKGILYGGFMATRDGVRLIEYNVRFGDPEVMNILSVLETDLGVITQAIVNRSLNELNVTFKNQASVCKYLVPDGYPEKPVIDQLIDVSAVDTSKVNLFFGSVDLQNGHLIEKGSRTVAIVGVADTLEQAEQLVETEIKKVTGPLFHRADIGTAQLIDQRVQMMKAIRHE